jgi:glutamate racemase
MVDDTITEQVARRYLSEIKSRNFSTVILGCTHYPVIKTDLIKVLGEGVKLVESGDALADELKALYQDNILIPDVGTRQIRVCITDLTDHFERLAHKLMAPEPITDLERVVL